MKIVRATEHERPAELARDQLRVIRHRRERNVRRVLDDTPFHNAVVLDAGRSKDGEPGPLSGMDWSGEDFSGCDLRGADLSSCCFRGADFSGTELWDADLRGSDLSGACRLLPAQLAATDLSGAQLPTGIADFE